MDDLRAAGLAVLRATDALTMTNPVDELAVWAVRYALGRSTYAVAAVVDTLIANEARVLSRSRATICEDIDRAIDRGDVGMDMDRREWLRLRAVLGEGSER